MDKIAFYKDEIYKQAATLTYSQRKALPKSMFGIPEEERFPMPDKNHVNLAWRSVNKAKGLTGGDKAKLKQRILARAKELGMSTKEWKYD